jgi:hypothetical protein
MKINKKVVSLLASYGRSILSAVLTLWLVGVQDPKVLALSLLGALVPVIIRFINPNDPAFGIVPSVADVDAALKNVKK